MCQVKWQFVWWFHCFVLYHYFPFPCSLTLTTFLSPLPSHTLSFCQTCVYFAYVLSLLPLRPETPPSLLHAPTPAPPSLAMSLCSSSWRLQLCSSFLLAFLVRYRCRFSTLFVSPLLYVHIARLQINNCHAFLYIFVKACNPVTRLLSHITLYLQIALLKSHINILKLKPMLFVSWDSLSSV